MAGLGRGKEMVPEKVRLWTMLAVMEAEMLIARVVVVEQTGRLIDSAWR